ncbi:hypothetical protein AALP_AAs39056U000200 [Arabis alpina]|uniref:BSD domain-containing protein n=1 Tax=Arabis alpina TaxID=50452 RepID=A0A087G1H8_ARAAL|nr:hypothetical protein AALP_AAs39056U000200 [Arabis alpina]
MNLFNSLLSESNSPPDSPIINDPTTSSSSPPSPWSFNHLIKTLTTKSESYRRDIAEFGSELKKETSVIRQVASRAVKDLPDSLELGASVAQESLESVGQAIDDIGATVWKSTAKIFSHGKESSSSGNNRSSSTNHLQVKPYSRFEMQLLTIQSDKGTYVREPDDFKDFEKWVLGFKFDAKGNEIVELMDGNKAVKEIYEEIVPVEVDAESFWKRYFYKVYKLELAEEARVKLVNRAISGEEEEDLSWDLDDEVDETETTGGESLLNPVSEAKSLVIEEENDGKGCERGLDNVESREVSSKDSDISVISTQPSLPEVEDLGWDQMEEDIRSNEGRRSLEAGQGSEEKSDWRKRVSVGDEEDDLTWDIEDEDDESSKQ